MTHNQTDAFICKVRVFLKTLIRLLNFANIVALLIFYFTDDVTQKLCRILATAWAMFWLEEKCFYKDINYNFLAACTSCGKITCAISFI
jgi:hypothetical protein